MNPLNAISRVVDEKLRHTVRLAELADEADAADLRAVRLELMLLAAPEPPTWGNPDQWMALYRAWRQSAMRMIAETEGT